MSKRVSCNQGYTIMEMLCYGAVLCVLANLALGAFVSLNRLNLVGMGVLEKARAYDRLRDDFTSTVRASSGRCEPPAGVPVLENRLVLRIPGGAGAEARYAVFDIVPDAEGEPGVRLRKNVIVDTGGPIELEKTVFHPVVFESLAFRVEEQPESGTPGLVILDARTRRGDTTRVIAASPRSLAHGGGGMMTAARRGEGVSDAAH